VNNLLINEYMDEEIVFMSNSEENDSLTGSEIAVIGIACRFPKARDVDEYWRCLRDGQEAITFLTDEELESSLVDPANPNDSAYVKAASILEDVELFDAAFFGFTPREAELMDPQHRLFLECSWHALEHAGYDPERYKGSIGVYAGARTNTYLFNLFTNRSSLSSINAFEIGLGNDLAFLPTRVSYKLNLRGPSYAVHTACSTSLVAVHLACQSLLIDECQIALAGGVAINVPQKTGYIYTPGSIVSPDGHCRAFDSNAQGTLFGSGVGIVVLKRLEEALADGDHIHAVIRGSATNNDGSEKASFTAPSVYGQAEVISEAIANAGIDPYTIAYVETHGTGTALGDPIEIRGLTKAFRANGKSGGFCAIGSVKSNLGHLDAAAGIASFIKTTLALEHKMIPPSLHFEEPNPNIDFQNTPFYVNKELREWKKGSSPRRAGVSAFGVGGTNAHVIVEEASPLPASSESRPWKLLLLSARTPTALDTVTANLVDYLKANSNVNLADVAYTLQVGRKPFGYRRIAACKDVEHGISILGNLNRTQVFDNFQETTGRPVAFMFPGGGAQYVNMGIGLYEQEEVFAKHLDECAEILKPLLGYDIKEFLFASPERATEMTEIMKQTSIALPALFTVEYALARLWMHWGIRPESLIGHSLGEYVAACLSGVFSLEDALSIVVLRGKLFEQLPRGSMLSVTLSEKEAVSLLSNRLSIAAVNGPSQCVISGPSGLIDEMADRLSQTGIEFHRLHIDVAAHSEMVEPILETFTSFIAKLKLSAPTIPFVSNVTGTWITDEEATDPNYWGRHLRKTVRFAAGIGELMKDQSRVFLEVGPGQTLSTLVKLQKEKPSTQAAISSIRHPLEPQADQAFLLSALGKLWLSGVDVNWLKFQEDERRHRLPLPTYPFERQRFWVEPKEPANDADYKFMRGKSADVSNWFHVPTWKRTIPRRQTRLAKDRGCWLMFDDNSNLCTELLYKLQQQDQEVIRVKVSEKFGKTGPGAYTINPRRPEDYNALIAELLREGKTPGQILHFWSITSGKAESGLDYFRQMQEAGYYSLLLLAQAIAEQNVNEPVNLWIVTNNLHEVESGDGSNPEKATILGPCKVIPQEYQNISCCCIDATLPESGSAQESRLVDQLVGEFSARSNDMIIALRAARRWVQIFEPAKLSGSEEPIRPLREQGVYLITGGLGSVGLLLGEYLAKTAKARLVLLGRTPLPERSRWEDWLATHKEDDETSLKIRKIKAMEEHGATVLAVSADVTNESQMRSVIERVYEQWGQLNGVIHAAGITSGSSVFNPIASIGVQESESQFQPKAYGLYILEQVLKDRDLDFCVMTSSNSSVLGGMGFVAYSAANAFMDAFASDSRRASQLPWISSSWDPWPEETKKYTGVQTSMDQYMMTPEESVEAFRRIICLAPEGHTVVATGDMQPRLDLWIRREYPGGSQMSNQGNSAATHARPSVQSIYVAPSNETEQAIADIWQSLLGIQQVGIHDNFFELGGHSLLATRLVTQLRSTFSVDLPLQKFFQSPTVAGLGEAILDLQTQADDFDRAEILEMLEQLSEEEVDAEINKRA
jgi:phthiocerol/phenolphthiocerol synthesis type-I polyketide synthase E